MLCFVLINSVNLNLLCLWILYHLVYYRRSILIINTHIVSGLTDSYKDGVTFMKKKKRRGREGGKWKGRRGGGGGGKGGGVVRLHADLYGDSTVRPVCVLYCCGKCVDLACFLYGGADTIDLKL